MNVAARSCLHGCHMQAAESTSSTVSACLARLPKAAAVHQSLTALDLDHPSKETHRWPVPADLLGSEFTNSSAAGVTAAQPEICAPEAVQSLQGGTDQLTASQLAAKGRQEHRQAAVSAQAIAALSELLHACLGKPQMPTLQSVMQEAQKREEEESGRKQQPGAAVTGHQQAPSATAQGAALGSAAAKAASSCPAPAAAQASTGQPSSQQAGSTAPQADAPAGERPAEAAEMPAEEAQTQPQLRWFDARGRVAIKRVAQWLNVPWQVVAKYECLLAQEAEVRATWPPESLCCF